MMFALGERQQEVWLAGSGYSKKRGRTNAVAILAALCLAGAMLITVLSGSASAITPYAHCKAFDFVGVRASGEPQGLGVTIGPLYNDFAAQVGASSTAMYALVYPAVGQPILNKATTIRQFFASVNAGTSTLQTYLENQVQYCPSQKIVVAGWSQGSTVVDRALRTLPQAVASHISGVALFGDPRFNPDFVNDVGTFDHGKRGVFRLLIPWYGGEQYIANSFVPETRSYCVAGDPVCNYSLMSTYRCLDSVTRPSCPHAQYVADGYVAQASTFLAAQVQN